MTPQDNFRFLNQVLGTAGPLIRKHNGFIDKYIGDAIMALFPQNHDDALRASLEIRNLLTEYNKARAERSRGTIQIGIGINTGKVILGTIGETERMEGTVISDAVNLASRLEGLTKFYGATIVISEQTLFRLQDPTLYNFRILDRVKVKGRSDPVSVFEVYDGDSPEQFRLKTETRSDFERGLQAYIDKEFIAAQDHFSAVLEKNHRDKAAYLYLQRSLYNAEHGVAPDWEGIAQMDMK